MQAILSCYFIALLWSDIFNTLLAGTPLIVWKQAGFIVMVAYVLVSQVDNRQKGLIVLSILITALMIAKSRFYDGVSLQVAAYNSFLYLAWVPFFVLFNSGLLFYSLTRMKFVWLPLFVLSVAGLLLDVMTDTFDFLARQGEGITLAFLQANNIAKRAAFFFVTSTMTIPLLAVIAFLALGPRPSPQRILVVAFGILVGGACTGSMSSLGVSILVAAGLIAPIRIRPMTILIAVTLLLSSLTIIASLLETETFSRQIGRIIENTFSDSQSNLERMEFWQDALHDVGRFSPMQHLLGAGLGATNDNQGNIAQFGHGESSFLQAYIELGVLGLAARLAPFVILTLLFFRLRLNLQCASLYAWTVASFIAVAFAPTFGSLPFQATLGLILAAAHTQLRLTRVTPNQSSFSSNYAPVSI